MKNLKGIQLKNIEKHILSNARTIEKVKWNYLFNNGSKEDIVSELVKYQNDDGGFGKGLEADIVILLNCNYYLERNKSLYHYL